MHPHLILYVRDQVASTAFYRHVLAQDPRLDVPGMTEFQLGEGAVLGLMPEAGIVRLLGGSVAQGGFRAELYLVVPDPGAFHRRALEAGATELSPLTTRSWGPAVAYSLDPDGNVLAFAAQPGAQTDVSD